MTVLAATQTLALGPDWLDPAVIIESLGPWALVGVAAIIFAECGLLLGFFLPGDSLLFTAGLFVASGAIDVPLWLVCVVLVVAAFVGNAVGYWIGYRAGPAIFDKPKSKLFNPKHVEKTHEFFEKYGNRAIVLGRFVPIVRTFITVSAGVARMDPKRYFTYSLVGGVAWAAGVTVLGYFLGQFAFVRENIDLILIAIVLLSVLPIVFEVVRSRAAAKRGRPVSDVGATGAVAAGAAAATVGGIGGEVDPAAVTSRMAAVPSSDDQGTWPTPIRPDGAPLGGPQHGGPQHGTPQSEAPRSGAAGAGAAGQAQAAPQHHAPRQAAPQHAAPQPSAPQPSAPQPSAPQHPAFRAPEQPGPAQQGPAGQHGPAPQRPTGAAAGEPPYRHTSGRPVMGRPDRPRG